MHKRTPAWLSCLLVVVAGGPLHDAAEMVPHMPVVMMFAYSSNGLSHCKEEDTPERHLEKSIRAFLRLVEKTIAHVAAS